MNASFVSSFALSLGAVLSAQDLGGGAPGNHGRVPRFVLESWIPTQPSALTFQDLPPGTTAGVAILSPATTSLTFPGIGGTIIADPLLGVAVGMSTTAPIPAIPPTLNGLTLFVQGLYLDTSLGPRMTDATTADFFNPVVMVGNQRQSSNSISVIDLVARQVVGRLGDSENGSISFTPDRTRAYVCEPGLQRNRVVVYDLTVRPIAVLTNVPTTGGVRYRAEIARDGARMYVPVHNGVDVVDIDPASPNYHTTLATIPTPITGGSGSIFTGPLDLAVTPDGSKLFIAYGENATWPANGTVGVVDLTAPGYPHRSIAVTSGGDFFGLFTRSTIAVSPDGLLVYTCEYGVPPGFPFSNGFAGGGLINVIDVATETEIATVATFGTNQTEMAVDRLGRNLWVPQTDFGGIGQVLRVDVDRHSGNRFAVLKTIQIDPTPFSATTGPRGIDVTPDGSTVVVSVVEDGGHPNPEVVTIDARTDLPFGVPIRVESLPATAAVQRY